MRTFVAVAFVAFTIAACSGSTSSSGGSCANDYSGTWRVSGGCNDTCTVTQSGCSVDATCFGGTRMSGVLNGASADVSGTGPDGSLGACTVTFRGASLDMSCSFGANSATTTKCAGTGTCTSGACGKALGGDGG
ncbi:MAG: hypothetical protein KF819_34300 [Labilithrix sp.]|nr:hypothetical protein [Labilithrix sp.]